MLPSLYEGLPGTVVEAQASGLHGIMSNTVTAEAVVTDLIQVRSIREDAETWATEIMKYSQSELDNGRRASFAEEVKQASFDVKAQAKRMQEFYLTGKLSK